MGRKFHPSFLIYSLLRIIFLQLQTIDDSTIKELSTNMQNENEIKTIHTSLLVVTKEGKLIRIHCPFPVQVVRSIETLKAGEVHKVVSVHMGELKIKYVIAGVSYSASFFIILLK